MRFELTEDLCAVKYILTHPKVYSHLVDDFAPPAGEFKPRGDIWNVLIYSNSGALLGLFCCWPVNTVLWEIHVALLPEGLGRDTHKRFLEWFWPRTDCQRLMTSVPEFNRLAVRFAISAGFSQFGINEQAFQKDKKLHNVVMLGINRPAVL